MTMECADRRVWRVQFVVSFLVTPIWAGCRLVEVAEASLS